ncbi:hypothetical protein [Aureimonas pseudogalii]|nr:hypothetical protein [Aureimonas pseudogalii]
MVGPHEDGNEDTDQANGNGIVQLQLGPGDGDAPSRVAAWRDAMAPTAELVLTPEEAEAFTASMSARRFGDLMVVRVTTSDHRLVRTRAMAALDLPRESGELF